MHNFMARDDFPDADVDRALEPPHWPTWYSETVAFAGVAVDDQGRSSD